MERTEKNSCVVLLNTLEKVKNFVAQMSTFDCDIDVLYRRYILDAKSIMSILSVDLMQPLKVVIHSDDYEDLKRFFEVMEGFK